MTHRHMGHHFKILSELLPKLHFFAGRPNWLGFQTRCLHLVQWDKNPASNLSKETFSSMSGLFTIDDMTGSEHGNRCRTRVLSQAANAFGIDDPRNLARPAAT